MFDGVEGVDEEGAVVGEACDFLKALRRAASVSSCFAVGGFMVEDGKITTVYSDREVVGFSWGRPLDAGKLTTPLCYTLPRGLAIYTVNTVNFE